MADLKLSTATTRKVFVTNSTNHDTGQAGLTLVCTLAKAGDGFLSVSPTVTDRGNGWYDVTLTTAHTDTPGPLVLHVTATGAFAADALYEVTTAGPDANVVAWAGAATGLSAHSNPKVAVVEWNDLSVGDLITTEPPTAPVIADAVWDEPKAGHLTVGTTGAGANATLVSTGLDLIAVTAPTTVPTTFPKMVVMLYRRFFSKSTLTVSQLKTYADDGTTVVTTQAVSDDGTTETQGAAS